MILRGIIPILTISCLSPIAAAQTPSTIPPPSEHIQDFSEVVVPITSLKITPSVTLGRGQYPVPTLDIGAIGWIRAGWRS